MFVLLALIFAHVVNSSCTVHSPRGTFKSNEYTADSECGINIGIQNYTIISTESDPMSNIFNLKMIFNETILHRTYNFTCSESFNIILSSKYKTNLAFQTYTTAKGLYQSCDVRIN